MVGGCSAELIPIGEEECTALLAGSRTGRLATTARALPVVAPVALVHTGRTVLLEPLVAELVTHTADAIVALEIGTLGADGEGWTVLLQGLMSEHAAPDSAGSALERRTLYRFQPAVVAGWRRVGASKP